MSGAAEVVAGERSPLLTMTRSAPDRALERRADPVELAGRSPGARWAPPATR